MRPRTRGAANLLLGTLVCLAGAGTLGACATAGGGGEVPFKDPAKGEFYTRDELSRLRGGQLDRYCQYMEKTLAELRAETARYEARRDSLDLASEEFRTSSSDLSSRLVKLQNEVRELRLKEKALTSYVIRPGDTLKSIAKKMLGDEARAKELFELNKAALGREDAELRVGSRLNMPRGKAPAGSKS